ncbi:GNAT family N-acetyltransferase [Rhodoblastus sp.]|uniref:GNAT family N-acetyltransferase n=1 Tax=Rhodoblastus sp. TaxID=1962975 RepID=UPI003F95A188
MPPFTVRLVSSIADVAPVAWDACANPPGLSESEAEGERFNPFVTHAFLHALEASGSTGGRSGWTPAHVIVEDTARIVAAAPSYLKSHSMGEYVFDHAWADAYARAGGEYYPKLQVAVPFTPATGRRLLTAHDAPEGAREALIAGLREVRRQVEASSIHVTFPTAEDASRLERMGFLVRHGEQFHVLCDGFSNFDDFLAALASRKRKSIKRERRDALGDDVTVEWLTGSAIKPEHWDAFFTFYMDTGSRKWGRPYLTRKFFTLVGADLADRILLVMAKRGGRYIAGAINFIGDDALYGRNWGAIEERPFLHFEVCYYQAIDFARSRGLKRVEAGAQGEHKLARGYRPVVTYSAHEFADARLKRAVADYLKHERSAVARTIAHYESHAPFRRGEGGNVETLGENFDDADL